MKHIEASELNVEDENLIPNRCTAFMDFDQEMPEAPSIDRSGIVVEDITEGFLDAAMSMF